MTELHRKLSTKSNACYTLQGEASNPNFAPSPSFKNWEGDHSQGKTSMSCG